MPTRHTRPLALAATALGFGVVQLDVTVVNVAIRPIGRDLGGDVSGLQWVVGAYTLVLAALLLSAGSLGDRFGAKRVYVAGFVVFTAASAVCGLAPTLGTLIAARAVQGVGAAALIPCSLAILRHTYGGAAERARAVGVWAACASVALSGGPLLGGVLIEWLGWRSVFFINVPLGAVGIALTLLFAAETSRTARRVDVPGQLLAVVGLAALAASTIEGGRVGFAYPLVLAGYAAAAVLGVAFVLVERRRHHPMLPLDLFGSPAFSASAAIGVLLNVGFYGLIFVLSLYFQEVRGLGPLPTGIAFAPMTVAVLAGNLAASRVAGRFGARVVLVAGSAGLALGMAGLLPATRDAPFAVVLIPTVIAGAALGVLVPTLTSTLLDAAPTERSGAASGVLNAGRQTGSVVGVALFGSLAAAGVVSGLRVSAGIASALAIGAVLLATRVRPDGQGTR